MTTVAQTFEALVAAVRHCTESELTEIHAVNLVSQLAALPEHKACVALVHAKNIPRYLNLFQTMYVWTFYGVRLSTTRHKETKAYCLCRNHRRRPRPLCWNGGEGARARRLTHGCRGTEGCGMKRLSIQCRLCNGTGRVEEFTCPCCLGSGTFEKPACCQSSTQCGEGKLELPERPRHANLFNTTPEYAMRKKRLLKTKRQRNTVALGILGLSDFHLESDEREGA